MRNVFRSISGWFNALALVFAKEWRIIFRDPGVMIFFVLLPLAYPIAYTLVYNPEVVRRVPIAVVDNSRTAESRKLVRDFSASPTVEIYDYCANMQDARILVKENRVYGILEIPADYAKNLGRMEQSHVTFFCDMSLMLRYRALAFALADIQMKAISDITADRLDMVGELGQGVSGLPIDNSGTDMGDTQQGFASFVMPGIVVLILQQSMVLGIVMLMGTARQRRRRNGGVDPELPVERPWTAVVWGKTLCYTVFYIAPTIFALHWIPAMFNLPHIGSPVQYMLFALPFLLASGFFGLTLGALVKDRESVFMVVVVTSVFFLFLCGLTWPRYAMPEFWQIVGDFIPTTWAVQGFILINSNNATLADVSYYWLWLWGLVVAYFILATLVHRYISLRGRALFGGIKK